MTNYKVFLYCDNKEMGRASCVVKATEYSAAKVLADAIAHSMNIVDDVDNQWYADIEEM